MSDDPHSFALARRHKSPWVHCPELPRPNLRPPLPSTKTTTSDTASSPADTRRLTVCEASALADVPSLDAADSDYILVCSARDRDLRCQNAAVQNSAGVPVAVGTTSSGDLSLAWCMLAVLLSLLGVQSNGWVCNAGDILAAVETSVVELLQKYALARSTLRSMLREHTTQDLFAACLDVLLVFYALGFLLMATYNSWLIA